MLILGNQSPAYPHILKSVLSSFVYLTFTFSLVEFSLFFCFPNQEAMINRCCQQRLRTCV